MKRKICSGGIGLLFKGIYGKKYNISRIISISEIRTLCLSSLQRCKRCTFDSPGLTSESEVYPGLFAISENNAVGVVPFIY
ncbi:MAG: hypothetical protein HXO16_07845 [Prevotella salivae]|nr:hypothetical protein [Segatella salivae]